jgi:hypothetical protein
MTQWYGPQGDFYHATGQGGAWVPGPNGGLIWQPYAGSSADPNKPIWYGPNANYPGAAPVGYGPGIGGGGTGGNPGGPATPAPVVPPGTGPGHWQSPGGGQPPVWVPDPQTGGTGPPPDPYQDWLSGDASSRSYRYFTPDLKQYYEQHPDEAYRQYTGSEFGDRQTPQSDYARSRYNDYWAQYIQASEADPTGGAGWTDYLTNNLAGKIRQSFTMQSPSQKGYSLMFQPSGRVTGF